MEYINRDCPLCGNEKSDVLLALNTKEFLLNNHGYHEGMIRELVERFEEEFHIVLCGGCGFQYAQELFPLTFASHLYENVIDHDKSQAKIFSGKRALTNLSRWADVLDLLDITKDKTLKLRVLDFGCGWGDFLEVAKAPGIECFGHELDGRKIEWVKSRGLKILESMEEMDANAPFDVIHCNQVLEHVPDPIETVKKFAGWLRPGGVMYASVPMNKEGMGDIIDCHEKDMPISKNINPWEHLNYFTPASFQKMLTDEGFVIRKEVDVKQSFLKRLTASGPASTSVLCVKI